MGALIPRAEGLFVRESGKVIVNLHERTLVS